MAKIKKKFSSNKHEDMKGFEVIPRGEYLMSVVESDEDEASSKKGSWIKLVWQIEEGEEFAGRKIPQWHNYINDNAEVQASAEQELATITRAIFGEDFDWSETEELHGVPVLCKVGIRKAKKDSDDIDNNVIRGYEYVGGEQESKFKKTSEEKPKKEKKEKKDKKTKESEKVEKTSKKDKSEKPEKKDKKKKDKGGKKSFS